MNIRKRENKEAEDFLIDQITDTLKKGRLTRVKERMKNQLEENKKEVKDLREKLNNEKQTIIKDRLNTLIEERERIIENIKEWLNDEEKDRERIRNEKMVKPSFGEKKFLGLPTEAVKQN